jgi:CRP-like cAMP-binding protein
LRSWLQADWRQPPCPGASANLLLRHLASVDRARVEPHLQATPVCRGMVLIEERASTDYVYFPLGALVSLDQADGAEIALIGNEGLVGWPALVGCTRSPHRAVVRGLDGTVTKIRTDVLMKMASEIPALASGLNRFVTVVGMQMAETIGAYALHRVDMRLARWLLLRHDRLAGDEIAVNHDEIATNLGTRRASITDCLHIIEGEGLVRCRRGRIVIRDRARLEALATGCYGTAESCYREIIGGFGKAPMHPGPPGRREEGSNSQLLSTPVC